MVLQISLGGITEDETSTDPNETRRRLRQRAEIARGRPEDESPRYDRHNFTNGQAARGRQFREREFSEASETDYEYDKRREAEMDRAQNRDRGGGKAKNRPHTNGGYKYSDESQAQSDHEDSDDGGFKKRLSDSEDETRSRNSFTPVKFKGGVEKELDSIQMNKNGSIQYMKQDDTGSVDLSGGRHLSRSMSSFSAHDAQNSPARSASEESEVGSPPPPAPLPLNIPAKLKTPIKPPPKPLPVPAPRAKPIPSARSYGSREDVSEPQEVKLNNLSQDEVSDYRGSRERLDEINSYLARKAPSRENLNYTPEPTPSVGAGVDFLPRKPQGYDDRDSPMHISNSRENLLPKRKDSDNMKPPSTSTYEPLRETDYSRDYYGQAQPRYGMPSTDPGVDYMGRRTPLNNEVGPGNDYLPPSLGMPMQSRHMIGHKPSVGNSNSDYESYDGGMNAPPPLSGRRLVDTTPGFYDQQPVYPSRQPPMPVPIAENYAPNVSRSRENLSHSRDNVSRSRENMSRSRENLARSRENLSRSRENFSGSRDNLNSQDFDKPRPQKSIETEI